MNDKPLVSIIINNYNYGRFLTEAIDTSLNQIYPKVEVIVVDDGSTDNSREIVSNYESKIVPVFKENGGQASAFNAGFAASKGEILCFLDSDDVFLDSKVAEVVEIFDRIPDIGWCFHTLRLVDKKTGELIGLSIERASRECDFRLSIKRGSLPFYPQATSGLCFRRSLLEQILPLPEELGCGDLYLRSAALAMSKGYFLDKDLTIQGIHENNSNTLKEDNKVKQRRAYNIVVLAYFMRLKFPELRKYTNRVFARGLSAYWISGGVETEGKKFIDNYLSDVSLQEKLKIGLMAIYQSRPWKKVELYRMLN
ncbi:MAG: glycosyltransferase [Prochloraceae cyanobacterium]|nr:glycosyltransferase [Prochloraceae cyanobacterium]